MKKKILLFALPLLFLIALFQRTTFASSEDTGFADVPPNAWYAEAVAYCQDSGLMSGTTANTFEPNATMTRAMLVTVIYRMAGEPAVTGGSNFTDVPADVWYTNAVAWAEQNQIVGVENKGLFNAEDNVSREEIAAMLWRYKGAPAAEESTTFADAGLISPYAVEAVNWAAANGIINGKENNLFDPAGLATRAEISALLMRFLNAELAADNVVVPTDKNNTDKENNETTVLIAYFSWSGHTEQIAKEIQAQTGGELFVIEPAEPYTSNINELSGIAANELRNNARPALSSHVADMSQYDVIFVGYPCWWSNMPMPVFTFLEEYDFAGKKIVPFTAYGENVFGHSLESIAELTPGASILDGLAVQEHNMQNLSGRISEWLQQIELK